MVHGLPVSVQKLLQASKSELVSLANDGGVWDDLGMFCESEVQMVDEVLLASSCHAFELPVDRREKQPLGITFNSSMYIKEVAPEKLGQQMGVERLMPGQIWKLVSIGGTKVSNTSELLEAFSMKKAETSLGFQRTGGKEVRLVRTTQGQALGIITSSSLLLEGVERGSLAESCGMAKYMGWKIYKIDHTYVTSPDDVPRLTRKPLSAIHLCPTLSRRHVTVFRPKADEKLGVTFSETLGVLTVHPGSLGHASGFARFEGRWKVVGVDGLQVHNTGELVEGFAGKLKCVFTLAPLPAAERAAPPQQAQPKKEGVSRNTREVTLTRKDAADQTGLFCSQDLCLEVVSPGSIGYRAGLNDLLGWRITAVNGKPVSNKQELKDGMEGKKSFSLTLRLDDDSLPSSVVQVDLQCEKTQKEILAAFGRYGGVSQVHATEKVSTVPCGSCEAAVALEARFCMSCGARADNRAVAPYYCHVTFQRVDDAKRAVSSPPDSALPGLLKVSFYHPPQQAEYKLDHEAIEKVAKPSALQMANALGFFNAWAVLGVPRDATGDEIRKAYKTQSILTHPDKKQDDSGEMFKAVAKAKAILTDKEQRVQLDKQVEAAIQVYGKKQVTSRFPVRNAKGEIRSPEDLAKDEQSKQAAGPAPSIFSGYTTASLRSGAASKPTVARSYAGLKKVEILRKEVRPAERNWDDDDDDDVPGLKKRRQKEEEQEKQRRKEQQELEEQWTAYYDSFAQLQQHQQMSAASLAAATHPEQPDPDTPDYAAPMSRSDHTDQEDYSAYGGSSGTPPPGHHSYQKEQRSVRPVKRSREIDGRHHYQSSGKHRRPDRSSHAEYEPYPADRNDSW